MFGSDDGGRVPGSYYDESNGEMSHDSSSHSDQSQTTREPSKSNYDPSFTSESIYELTSMISAVEDGCSFIKRRGQSSLLKNDHSKDSFPFFKSQTRWFSIQWDGTPSQWRLVYCKDKAILKDDNYLSVSKKSDSDKCIYFNDITDIYLEPDPNIGLRVYRDREVLQLIPSDVPAGSSLARQICERWYHAIDSALRLLELPEDITFDLRQKWYLAHKEIEEDEVEDDGDNDSSADKTAGEMNEIQFSSSLASTESMDVHDDDDNDDRSDKYNETQEMNQEADDDRYEETNAAIHSSQRIPQKSKSFGFMKSMRALLNIGSSKKKSHMNRATVIGNANDCMDEESLHPAEGSHGETIDDNEDVYPNKPTASMPIKGILKHGANTDIESNQKMKTPSLFEVIKRETEDYDYNNDEGDDSENMPAVIQQLLELQKNDRQLYFEPKQRQHMNHPTGRSQDQQYLTRRSPDRTDSSRNASVSFMSVQNPSRHLVESKNALEDGANKRNVYAPSSIKVNDAKSTIIARLFNPSPSLISYRASNQAAIEGIDLICTIEKDTQVLKLTQLSMTSMVTRIHLTDILVAEYLNDSDSLSYFKLFVSISDQSRLHDVMYDNKSHCSGWLNFKARISKDVLSWLQILCDVKSKADKMKDML